MGGAEPLEGSLLQRDIGVTSGDLFSFIGRPGVVEEDFVKRDQGIEDFPNGFFGVFREYCDANHGSILHRNPIIFKRRDSQDPTRLRKFHTLYAYNSYPSPTDDLYT